MRAGLAAIAFSVVCTAFVALAGPSVMEPALPGRAGQPPWDLNLHLSAYAAVGLTAAALAAGTLGLALCLRALTLRALRGGRTVSARAVLLAGIGAAAVLTLLPPFGSSDHLSYAAYGRMVATGHNPWTTTPAQLAALGDPVARAVQDWSRTPSVYGPLAAGVEGLASLIGGTSARLTVFMLGVANLIAFALTALLLHAMAAGQPGRQLRAALLWTANPLLLQVLVAGAHVDTQAIVFCVAAIAVMVRSRGAAAAGAAGMLIGFGFAVKVTAALAGLGLALALASLARDRPAARTALARLAALAAGFAVVAGAALAIGGSPMLKQASSASDMVSIGSPWRAIRAALQPVAGHAVAGDLVKYGALALAVALAVLLIRGLPRLLPGTAPEVAVPEVAVPLALIVAWLFAWPYVLPWYDALGWAVLALAPASGLDWLMLARTAALGFAYLPARSADVRLPAGLTWLQPVFRNAVAPVVLAIVTVWLVAAITGNRREYPI